MTLPTKDEIQKDIMDELTKAVKNGKLSLFDAQYGCFIGLPEMMALDMDARNRELEKLLGEYHE